jgi:hypothetical protein
MPYMFCYLSHLDSIRPIRYNTSSPGVDPWSGAELFGLTLMHMHQVRTPFQSLTAHARQGASGKCKHGSLGLA